MDKKAVIETVNSKEICRLQCTARTMGLAITADGILCCGWSSNITYIDLNCIRAPEVVLSHDNKVSGLYSTGNRLLSAALDCRIKYWDTTSTFLSRPIKTVGLDRRWVMTCCVSKDEKAYSGGLDNRITVHNLMVNHERPLHVLAHEGYVSHLLCSPDDRWLFATSGDGKVTQYDRATHTIYANMHEGTNDCMHVCLSPSNSTLYSCYCSGIILSWDLTLAPLHGSKKRPYCQKFVGTVAIEPNNSDFNTCQVSPDGKFLYAGCDDGYIYQWALDNSPCDSDSKQNEIRYATRRFCKKDYSTNTANVIHAIALHNDLLIAADDTGVSILNLGAVPERYQLHDLEDILSSRDHTINLPPELTNIVWMYVHEEGYPHVEQLQMTVNKIDQPRQEHRTCLIS